MSRDSGTAGIATTENGTRRRSLGDILIGLIPPLQRARDERLAQEELLDAAWEHREELEELSITVALAKGKDRVHIDMWDEDGLAKLRETRMVTVPSGDQSRQEFVETTYDVFHEDWVAIMESAASLQPAPAPNGLAKRISGWDENSIALRLGYAGGAERIWGYDTEGLGRLLDALADARDKGFVVLVRSVDEEEGRKTLAIASVDASENPVPTE